LRPQGPPEHNASTRRPSIRPDLTVSSLGDAAGQRIGPVATEKLFGSFSPEETAHGSTEADTFAAYASPLKAGINL
jgi:hypothetical protein